MTLAVIAVLLILGYSSLGWETELPQEVARALLTLVILLVISTAVFLAAMVAAPVEYFLDKMMALRQERVNDIPTAHCIALRAWIIY